MDVALEITDLCNELKEILSDFSDPQVESYRQIVFPQKKVNTDYLLKLIIKLSDERSIENFIQCHNPNYEPKKTDLEAICDEIRDLLISKNTAYGNSAFEPVMNHSELGVRERLAVRMDDKISRMVRGTEKERVPEDTLLDYIGYAILDMIASKHY